MCVKLQRVENTEQVGGRKPPEAPKRNVTESERQEPQIKTVTVGKWQGFQAQSFQE